MFETGWIWILAATGLYGWVHSVLAANSFKSWAARVVGPAVYHRTYRLFFVGVSLLTALPIFFLVVWLPDRLIYQIPSPWQYAALAVQLAGVVLGAISVLQTGLLRFVGLRQVLGVEMPESGERLVTGGLYRWVRHPIYSASFLLLWATPVMTWNIFALNLGFSLYLFIGSIFEERKLIEQFGDAYEQYRMRTPRFLPRVWKTR